MRRRIARLLPRFLLRTLSVLLLTSSTASIVAAQDSQDSDPLKGTYKLGESSELILLWADPSERGSRVLSIYDYLNLNNPDPDVPNQISAKQSETITSNGVPENVDALDALSADFDGDGLDDYVAVWEGPDRSIEMIIPTFDRTNLTWTASNLTTVAPAGSMLDDPDPVRLLRLAAGDFDEDPASEFILAYFGANAALQIELYKTAEGGTAQLLSSTSVPDILRHLDADVPDMVRRSSRWFDVNAGDFDGDGTDEVIVAASRQFECAFAFGCWSVVARVYDVHPETFALVERAEATFFTKENNASEFMNRIAVEPGRFGPEFEHGAALVFQQTTNNNFTQWYLAMSRVLLARDAEGNSLDPGMWGSAADTSRFEIGPDGTDQIHQTNGQRGFSLSARATDFHQDGIDELVLYHRQVQIFEMDEDFTPRVVSSHSGGSEPGDAARHALAVSDLDADNDLENESSRWLPEISFVQYQDISDDGGIDVDGILSISVIGWDPDVGFNSRELAQISDHRTDRSGARPIALAAVDVGDDGVRVGPPKRSARTNIVRPLIILNAPPTHFDMFDEQPFDVNRCYGAEDCACHTARARCFQAEYTTETERSITMETELTTDWSIATTVDGGFKIPIIKVGVEASITGTYGEGFRRTDRNTETFTVRQAIQATRDDWIYAMIVNYDIWEYPLYAEGDQVGYIAVVLPRLNTRAWFDSKSWNAFDYVPFHEVGNILSYRSIASPEQNSLLAEAIRWNTGDQITLSGSSDVVWQLTSEAQTESESAFSVNMGINGTVDFDIPFSFIPDVSVEGDYSTETINTQSMSVRDTKGMAVVFGNVDQSFGNTRYDVIPYVYWAKNGALVLDYAVNPELAQPGFEPTWWQTHYGERPDPAFILPWRYDREKGADVTDAQMLQTREILFDPLEPEVGEIVTIKARLHNWSLIPTPAPVEVRFFVGDPAAGGVPIVGTGGETSVTAPQMTDRGSAVVEMDWEVPSDLGFFPRIYAVIDPLDAMDEIHESNNKGWTVLNVSSGATAVEPAGADELPAEARLFQNYPNPFARSTTIGFSVPDAGKVTLQVIDLLGREVRRLVDSEMPAGTYNVMVDGAGLSSGVYVYRLQVGGTVQTRSMMVVR